MSSRRGKATSPIGYHVSMRLEDDRQIATTAIARRVLARVFLKQGECRGLVSFGCADTHAHAELITDRVSAGEFARYVQGALVTRLGLEARFRPASISPLRDQSHAINTFHYVHRQLAHHGLSLDCFREGFSLPDLLGLRLVSPSIIARVRAQFPRLERSELIDCWPLELSEDLPLDVSVLIDAAAAAFGLPHLDGRSADTVRAKRALVHAAGAKIDTRALSDGLRLGMRAVQEMRLETLDATAVRAVTLQARLRGHASSNVLVASPIDFGM